MRARSAVVGWILLMACSTPKSEVASAESIDMVILVAAHASYLPMHGQPDTVSALKSGFSEMVDTLRTDDRVKVWLYNWNGVSRVSGWTDKKGGKIALAGIYSDEKDYSNLMHAQDPRLYRAMEAVLAADEGTVLPGRRRVVVVVSDGLDAMRDDLVDGDELRTKRLERVAASATKTKTKLYLVGYSTHFVDLPTHLGVLAKMSDGFYVYADGDEEGVQQALERVAVEVGKDRSESHGTSR
jgi:hypothetical protein